MKEEIKKTYTVVENIKETPYVSTLKLALDGKIPAYCPGQFITVYFPELGTPEGKAYSISSAPHEKTLTITIKAMGLFSNKLVSLRPGDTLIASLPYGYFFSESEDSPLNMIASGIGITPFRGMIIEVLKKNPKREIKLFYTVKKFEDLLFKKEFDKLESSHPNFKAFYFITKEPAPRKGTLPGRMDSNDILGKPLSRCGYMKSYENHEFLICGSISFVRDIWKSLRSSKIPEIAMYTEAFFSH